jgi:hypothetical protein
MCCVLSTPCPCPVPRTPHLLISSFTPTPTHPTHTYTHSGQALPPRHGHQRLTYTRPHRHTYSTYTYTYTYSPGEPFKSSILAPRHSRVGCVATSPLPLSLQLRSPGTNSTPSAQLPTGTLCACYVHDLYVCMYVCMYAHVYLCTYIHMQTHISRLYPPLPPPTCPLPPHPHSAPARVRLMCADRGGVPAERGQYPQLLRSQRRDPASVGGNTQHPALYTAESTLYPAPHAYTCTCTHPPLFTPAHIIPRLETALACMPVLAPCLRLPSLYICI